MTDASIPIEIGGETYHLRFERSEGRALERQFKPILMLLQPAQFGWDTASLFLWKGLKKETPDGKLEHVFSQDAAGQDAAFEMTQAFTNQFPGAALGISMLYASIDRALIVSGWYQAPGATTEPKDGQEVRTVDPTKN